MTGMSALCLLGRKLFVCKKHFNFEKSKKWEKIVKNKKHKIAFKIG